MPRRPRLFVEGLIYHVYNRVGRGEAPFKLDDEADRFVSLLGDVKRRDGLTVFAWCLMPNHFHLAVRTSTVPLWRSMRFLQHRYAQAFNRRCRVFGPLWQSRYKARPVTEQVSLLRLLAYIHLNPVAAGMVDDPERYRWSGHRELVRRAPGGLVDADEVFALFGGTRRQALTAYLGLLRQEQAASWLGAAVEALPWWGAAPEADGPPRNLDALGRSPAPARRRLTAAEFLAHVTPLLGVSTDELASPQRGPGLVEARELLGALAVERWQIGVKALADALGKSRDGV
ncbi:MAG: transposase, partial [Acidobacteria bacterium]|nr:transposase [Acidobacteriota bacterium]